jgi:glycosyltransferase involved in cell wall biosynthesis
VENAIDGQTGMAFRGDRHTQAPVKSRKNPIQGEAELMTQSIDTLAARLPSRRYCLISPCRDEAEFARITLACIDAQTIRPALWVIVDDGSTDATPALLADFAASRDWVRVLRRDDRGSRRVGPGVIDAFYAGYDTINPDDFDYVCKIDVDLDLPPTYFERMIERMEANPRLATISGKPYMRFHGRLVSELCGDENSVGMVKFFRTAAFQEIGGFVRQVMWDGIDGHRCRMHGWQARSVDDPETRFIHLRPMGTSQTSWWAGRARHGFGQYFMGTGFTYMFASCLFRLAHPPAVIGSVAMLWGWLSSAYHKLDRYDDIPFRQFLKRYHRACLIQGKARATAAFDAEALKRWNPTDAVRKS